MGLFRKGNREISTRTHPPMREGSENAVNHPEPSQTRCNCVAVTRDSRGLPLRGLGWEGRKKRRGGGSRCPQCPAELRFGAGFSRPPLPLRSPGVPGTSPVPVPLAVTHPCGTGCPVPTTSPQCLWSLQRGSSPDPIACHPWVPLKSGCSHFAPAELCNLPSHQAAGSAVLCSSALGAQMGLRIRPGARGKA